MENYPLSIKFIALPIISKRYVIKERSKKKKFPKFFMVFLFERKKVITKP